MILNAGLDIVRTARERARRKDFKKLGEIGFWEEKIKQVLHNWLVDKRKYMWDASIELRWSLIGSRERYSYDNGLFSCRVFTVSDDVQRTHNSFSNSFLEQHTRRWRSCFFSTARPTGPLFYRTRCGRDLITWGLSNEMDVLREFENSTVDTRKKKQGLK